MVKDVEQPDQGNGPQRHVHGAGPVDAPGQRVGGRPFLDDFPDRLGVAFLAAQQIGLPRRDQPLQARQLPRHLDVAVAAEVEKVEAAAGDDRPGMAAFEVLVPRDGGSELDRAGAQKIDPAPACVIGGGQNAGAVAGAEGFVLFQAHRPGEGGRRRLG